ncbi:AbfB domain-containing protein [Micromonospora sp. LOL_025]|uniref:AbfB domain-containing protein n=1 Tax=Micromonospora sp. LOL_025 TaxID=3345413 RepID=UPI003A8729CF
MGLQRPRPATVSLCGGGGSAGRTPGGAGGLAAVTTPGFTDRYLRHRDNVTETSVITAASPDVDRRDAQFFVRPGLADPDCVSLAAVNVPGTYLRHRDFRVRLDPYLDNSLFRADATFCPEDTVDGFRLRSINLPDRYLRHYQAAGYVAAPGGTRASDAQASFDADVTWRAGPPLGI